jgi:hypothetical protein
MYLGVYLTNCRVLAHKKLGCNPEEHSVSTLTIDVQTQMTVQPRIPCTQLRKLCKTSSFLGILDSEALNLVLQASDLAG